MTNHSARCLENALGAIAENNAATLAADPDATLTPETEAEALEWLANGNVSCHDEGDYCS